MAKLTYSTLASLDGYIEDPDGGFGWALPDEEVHGFVNQLERDTRTMLLGRKTYETLLAWETMETAGQPREFAEFAEIWRRADKVVYSRTLEKPSSALTSIEHDFDPDAVRAMKAGEGDLAIGGPALAAEALRAGLVDEIRLFLFPVVVGGGKRALPEGVALELEPLDERRFANGVVYLSYRVES